MSVRWGIIGCGDIARKRVAGAIQDDPNSRLLAVCRRDMDKLRCFCEDFGIDRSYTDDAQLIADPEIDAVYVATPVHLHLPQTIVAARAGKHVLVEKPMALSVAECDTMIAACRDAGVKLGVAYYRRFYPVVLRMKQLLAEGAIGTPMAVSAVTSSPFPLAPGDDGYWRVRPDEGGGGALMDIGSHRLNLFLDLFGDVAQVHAQCGTVAADYEAEDTATVLLKFASGVHGTLQCYFGTATEADEFTILGTDGRLCCSPLNGSTLGVETAGNRRNEEHPPHDNLHAPLVSDFTTAILEDREPTVTGAEGRVCNEVMYRAYEIANE